MPQLGNWSASSSPPSQKVRADDQESDPAFKGYASGNDEVGRGFGHICVAVDNLEAAVKRFDEEGVKFKKRPEEGKMRVSTDDGGRFRMHADSAAHCFHL
jgi:catechol 2,3-dioxygenase-like lactoylglutathione lyase family enzyme